MYVQYRVMLAQPTFYSRGLIVMMTYDVLAYSMVGLPTWSILSHGCLLLWLQCSCHSTAVSPAFMDVQDSVTGGAGVLHILD